MSNLLAEFNSLCNIKHFVSTPYHPQTNGIVERFHSTLKSMIRKLSHESRTEWYRFVPAALFAYRGQVHSSTGFSPFFLLFGRAPRGPMQILSDVFFNKDLSGETSFQYHYVIDLHNRIRNGWRLAQDAVRDSVDESRLRHEPKSKLKHFVPGDEVLVLLPTSDNKLVLSYKGPYRVVEKRTRVVYLVDLGDRKCTFHVNLLRKYRRSTYPSPPSDNLVGVDSACSSQAFVGATSFCDPSVFPFSSLSAVEPSLSVNSVIDENLDSNHDSNLMYCETICFAEPTALTTDDVIRVKPYPLPFAAREFVTQEVNDLLSLGVIEPSDSPYCFPIVVVKKKDGSMRLCIDFRKLNAITVIDAENISLQEDLFNQLSHATIFSSCDLCKAYWQVPLHPDSRKYTAFQTPLGLMQWVRMPFGLFTAPATFCRLMRLVIGQTPDLLSYFDDTLVFATSWQQHIVALRSLLVLLRRHGLHVNPSKVSIGSSSVEFLGHVVSSGTLVPAQKKMDKILQLSVPVKKKEVRSLLGLVNYYRHFIANFASISAPLSDLLHKGTSEKVQWTPRCDQSLAEIKRLFSSPPILIIPDMQEMFIVRSDASDFGIGAVLLQDREGILMPSRYASRKLLSHSDT
ncbi:reverse transcriptase [Plakobranchus ocellatus]|uniref:Reverse transcriptase n=1 Tax=Plakobranchus ocellatus TaxID=259542 RepID=A0AAV4CZR1_9GAST|nr:reverse transcriptase [Plakobranchus ocellatus]